MAAIKTCHISDLLFSDVYLFYFIFVVFLLECPGRVSKHHIKVYVQAVDIFIIWLLHFHFLNENLYCLNINKMFHLNSNVIRIISVIKTKFLFLYIQKQKQPIHVLQLKRTFDESSFPLVTSLIGNGFMNMKLAPLYPAMFWLRACIGHFECSSESWKRSEPIYWVWKRQYPLNTQAGVKKQ